MGISYTAYVGVYFELSRPREVIKHFPEGFVCINSECKMFKAKSTNLFCPQCGQKLVVNTVERIVHDFEIPEEMSELTCVVSSGKSYPEVHILNYKVAGSNHWDAKSDEYHQEITADYIENALANVRNHEKYSRLLEEFKKNYDKVEVKFGCLNWVH